MEHKFTCPKCKHHELSSVEQVIMTYPITKIPDDGDLNYDYDNRTAGDSQILSYQCRHCGFELRDEQDNSIVEQEDVIEWIKKKTSEKKDV